MAALSYHTVIYLAFTWAFHQLYVIYVNYYLDFNILRAIFITQFPIFDMSQKKYTPSRCQAPAEEKTSTDSNHPVWQSMSQVISHNMQISDHTDFPAIRAFVFE